MTETTIFYFTGTGNSLKVAKDIAAGLSDTKLIRISRKNLQNTDRVYAGTIGIVFPVYFSGLPHMVRQFAENIRVDETSYVFGVATYGGMLGIAFDQLVTSLGKNRILLSAAFGVLMPGNNQVLYPPIPVPEQQERFRKERDAVAEIIKKVGAKENISPKPVNFIIHSLLCGFYSLLKPNERSRHFHADENCNGCGTCSQICPAENITMHDKRPVWHHWCEYCLACMQWCPMHAIQYANKTQKRGRYHHPDIGVRELYQHDDAR
jgi:Pyruvate/2-oxoacid:ferredoxin oxidoreductase delta subunit